MAKDTGKIIQVVGVVIDVEFPEGAKLPAIYDALTTQRGDETVTLEVAQHLSERSVRAIAMSGTDGLKRGADVASTGAPIQVPVGAETQGRMFNVTGDAIDGKATPKGKRAPIHREPPALSEQSNKAEILETGIKVVDLIAPLAKGGKAGFLLVLVSVRQCLLPSLLTTLPSSIAVTRYLLVLVSEPAKETTSITRWKRQRCSIRRHLYLVR